MITDEIRLTIAAQACMLLLHRKTDIYPLLQSILVYPHAFVAPLKERGPGGVVIEDFEERDGESWDIGALVLSWDDVLESVADDHDGYNVVFHEFAHQLDDESGIADGAPPLPERSMYADWARVLGAEYDALVEAVRAPPADAARRVRRRKPRGVLRRRDRGVLRAARASSRPLIPSSTSSSPSSTRRIPPHTRRHHADSRCLD